MWLCRVSCAAARGTAPQRCVNPVLVQPARLAPAPLHPCAVLTARGTAARRDIRPAGSPMGPVRRAGGVGVAHPAKTSEYEKGKKTQNTVRILQIMSAWNAKELHCVVWGLF